MSEYPRIDIYPDEETGEWIAVDLDCPEFCLKNEKLEDLTNQLVKLGLANFEHPATGTSLDKEIPCQTHFTKDNRKRLSYRDMHQESVILSFIEMLAKDLEEYYSRKLLNEYDLWIVEINNVEPPLVHYAGWYVHKFNPFAPGPDKAKESFHHVQPIIGPLLYAYCVQIEILRQVRNGNTPDIDLELAFSHEYHKWTEQKPLRSIAQNLRHKDEKFRRSQSEKAKKPKSMIGERAEAIKSMDEIVKRITKKHENENCSAKELWPIFLSELDKLGADPEEIKNPDFRKTKCEYSPAKGDNRRPITFGRFANIVAEHRRKK